MASLTPRALARAAVSEDTMELELLWSKASRSVTRRAVITGSSPSTAVWAEGTATLTPMMASSDRQISVSLVTGASSRWWMCTSRMRAVSSARST